MRCRFVKARTNGLFTIHYTGYKVRLHRLLTLKLEAVNNMKKKLFQLTAAAVLAGGTFLALAQEVPSQPAQPAPAHQRRAARIAQYLGLTPDQQTQIRSQFQAMRQSMQPVRQQLKQVRANMFQAIRANDTASIQQLSAQEATLKSQLIAARSETMAKVYSTLTPAQQAKADQLPAHIQQMRQRRMQNRQNPNNG